MIIPFLFTMGLCLFVQIVPATALQMTDLFPQENKVHIQSLSNGIKVFLQESSSFDQLGSIQIVLRTSQCNDILYTYDGVMDNPEEIENFFLFCTHKMKGQAVNPIDSFSRYRYTSSTLPKVPETPLREMAVIAVGNFSREEILGLIDKHFGEVLLASYQTLLESSESIQIDTDAMASEVAISVRFPNTARTIQTYGDLKEAWKYLILQDLYQQRLERCSRSLEKAWIHPHPRFFYPVEGYSLISHEMAENLLALILWQIENIRREGFAKEEFYSVKHGILGLFQYLSSVAADPNPAFLASYYADQFLLGNQCLGYEPFLAASIELIEEIQFNELFPYIDDFLAERHRSIHLVYPEIFYHCGLTKDQIEDLTKKVSSILTSSQSSEVSEEGNSRMFKNHSESQESWIFNEESKERKTLPIRNEETAKTIPLRLADNLPWMAINAAPDSVALFHQLPLNDKEKRLMKSIFTTMAEKDIIQLALIKRTMTKKGRKVNRVHPMRFAGYLFSNPELKSCMKKIAKSSFKWDAFVDGFSRRMKEENSNNNLHKYVPGFCQEVGANPDEISRYINKRDWEGVVKCLL